MTLKKLSLYFIVQWVILAFLKVWFFNNAIFSNAGIQQIIFWALLCVVGAAMVRRFGVINFFESFFVITVWVLGGIFLDLLITVHFTGQSIFATREYWTGYILFALSIFLFHKKRHLQVRHELHAKAHAAAHPHQPGHTGDGHKH